MGKKDLNFIRFVNPQIKERERNDRDVSKIIAMRKVDDTRRANGMDPFNSINLDDIALFNMLLSKRRKE